MDADDSFTFCQSDLRSASFATFEDMRKNGELCDFTIMIQNREITAHRVVVAAGIPYFRSVFERDGYKEITLGDIDSKAFESLIDFAYSSRITISGENVNQLLFASHFLRLDKVLEECVKFVSKRLDVTNLWQVRTLAFDLDVAHLIEISDLYIQDTIEGLSKSEEFLNLPHSHLLNILSKTNFNAASEKVLFDAVLDWVKFSPSERQAVLPELLDQIRLVYLPIDYLTEKAASEEVIRTSVICRDMIDEVKNYHIFPKKRSKFPNLKVIPRKFSGLYSVCEEGSTVSVSYCDFVNQMWHDVSRYQERGGLIRHVVAVDEKLYIFRGNTIDIFNTKTLEWNVILQEMNKKVAEATVTTTGNGIYGFGSSDFDFAHAIWCFDTEKNEWLEKGKMNERRFASAAATFEEQSQCIYVTGGFFCANTAVEKYYPSTNECSIVAPMLTKRAFHSAASMNRKIYVCGGTQKSHPLEMYDPRVDRWTYISSMNTTRFLCSLVTHNGKIHVLGGYHDLALLTNENWPDHSVREIQIYSPESDEWESSFRIPEGFRSAVDVI